MAKYFRILWNTISVLRVVVLNLVFIVIISAIVISLAAEQEKPIESNTPLLINPAGFLVDKSSYDTTPLELLMGQENQQMETTLRDITTAIYAAAGDDRINAIILKLDHLFGGGISKLEEIGEALETFKSTGKPVITYGQSYNQQQYFLASYADEIYLHQMGSVFLTGYGMYRNYMKDAADKLLLDFHVFRVGEYKDAIENFTRNSMSNESREHNQRWIQELWQRYTKNVESIRDLTEGTIDKYIVGLSDAAVFNGRSNAEFAEALGLVDKIVDSVTVKDIFKKKFGTQDEDKIKHVSFSRYLSDIQQKDSTPNAEQIGLIVAQGTIVDGQAPETSIGSSSFVELLKRAQKDYSLKALIIRVDSGGGSAFASEIIREHIEKMIAKGIPVYISMGSIAASGGYWMSVPATEIWATPATITGSIGVWGLVPNFTQSLAKLGIYSDGIGTSPIADIFHPDREMSEPAKQLFQRNVEHIYHKFINLVAEGRNQDPAAINEIAQGRVWTGNKALELGLVDKLGSLQALIDSIASDLDTTNFEIVEIERPLSPQEQFIRSIMEGAQTMSDKYQVHLFEAITGVEPALFSQLKSELSLLNRAPQSSANNISAKVYAKCFECLLEH